MTRIKKLTFVAVTALALATGAVAAAPAVEMAKASPTPMLNAPVEAKVNEYEGQHREAKVNEYEGQHRVAGKDPEVPVSPNRVAGKDPEFPVTPNQA